MTPDEARWILAGAGVPDPATDARRLFEFALKSAGAKPGGDERDNPGARTLARYREVIAQRARRVPVARIVGGREFWKGWFKVTPDVLDPRPDTETLVECALSEPFSRILDLGTGSGCIVISLLMDRPGATGVGTDISGKAILVAGENAAFHGVANRLILPLSDWYDDIGGRFDLIVSNPPYIAAGEIAGLQPEVRDHEPRIALTDDGDGLSAYRRIAAGAADHLTPGGRVLVEIAPTQGQAVTAIFRAAGLEDVAIHTDLDERDRVVSARRSAAGQGDIFA